MTPVDPGSARELLEAIISGFSVLGGGMAYFSGLKAAQALAQDQPAEVVAHAVNEGIGRGFAFLAPMSVIAPVIMLWP